VDWKTGAALLTMLLLLALAAPSAQGATWAACGVFDDNQKVGSDIR
jgi:hypothetical protein